MTPEVQLKTFINIVNETVEKLRTKRETLNNKKIEINSKLLELLETATSEANSKIEAAYEEGKDHINNLVPKGQELRDRTSELKNKLQAFVVHYSSVNTEAVLSEEARANIGQMLSKPEEVVSRLEQFRETLGNNCNEFEESILSKLDEFDQNVDDFVNSSEGSKRSI